MQVFCIDIIDYSVNAGILQLYTKSFQCWRIVNQGQSHSLPDDCSLGRVDLYSVSLYEGPKGLYNMMISMRNGICNRANRIDGTKVLFFVFSLSKSTAKKKALCM